MPPLEGPLFADPLNVFSRCVEDCGEAIMITDLGGKLVYVNPAWCRIYGFSREEALGQTPRLLHSGFHDTDFYAGMWNAVLDPARGTWKGEVVNKAKDGTLIPVLLTITSFRDRANSIAGHMGIALDLRAQKQLEAKVLHADRLASIGVLASGLAHEVGTPLGVVRGRAEFLLMQPETRRSDVLGVGLQTIVTQIDRISKLISSLLRFSRATDDVRLEDVELAAVVKEVLELVGQNLRSSSIEVKLDIPRGLRVLADFNRLQQILLNLVVNAIQAIQTARRDGPRRDHAIVLHAESRDRSGKRHVVLTVQDSGCGIEPGDMRNLFQPFFTTKDVGEGTGLGLAIVSKLVHEMNGEVSVGSILGKGATFSITLRTP